MNFQINDIIDFFGGTILGAMIQVTIGTIIFFLDGYALGVDMDAATKWAIKIGSLIVVILGIVNGWIAYKRNIIELKKLKAEQDLKK